MLDSVPVPFRAILYPLGGAVIIAALGRLLPGWLRRLLATAAATASLVSLWSLRNGSMERVELFWEPLNFFRMSPTLNPDSLSLLTGLTLAGVSAAMALGIRGTPSQRINWHGILLIALVGCQITTMATNLPTMAIGSAVVDLMLIILALSAPESVESNEQIPLSAAVPGIASTLLLVFGALQMDAQVGHTSLLAQSIPEEILPLVGVAGALRLLIFPLHPRGWKPAQRVATLLLPAGVGIYLLARAQTLAPAPIGALLTWSGSNSTGFARFWSGMLVYQTGGALAFSILLGGTSPWPLLALTLPMASLAIWWDGGAGPETTARHKLAVWLEQRVHPWQVRARTYVAARFPVVQRWRILWWIRHGAILLAIPALASLAGAPLTVGARARWPFHATLLSRGDPFLLLVLVADTLVAAALWTRFARILKETDGHDGSHWPHCRHGDRAGRLGPQHRHGTDSHTQRFCVGPRVGLRAALVAGGLVSPRGDPSRTLSRSGLAHRQPGLAVRCCCLDRAASGRWHPLAGAGR
jgi:hypothetical protein